MGNATLFLPPKSKDGTLSLPRYHLKTTSKGAKLEIVKVLAFFFAVAGERIFIKSPSTESRFVMGLGNLLIGMYVHFSGWGSEGVKN